MFCRPLLPVLVTLIVGLNVSASIAHEFWIEPQEYQVETGASLLADLRNGENFSGREQAFIPNRYLRFDVTQNGETFPLEGRLGDIPAVQGTAVSDGLLVMAIQTKPQTLKYATWEKFAKFAAHKDFADIKARHDARGLPNDGFSEVYSRFSKTLVGIGDAQGFDAPTGLETEFVALTNPYTDGAGSISVQLLYQGAPRTDVQIEVFEQSPDGKVTVTFTRTDMSGQAEIPTKAGFSYLLDAVVLRPASEDQTAVWETLWAALTFGVPNKP